MDNQIVIAILVAALLCIVGSVITVQQGHVAVTVLFGRYRRLLRPGLSLRVPWIEQVFRKISLQHRGIELDFAAITRDQANVNFRALILYAVRDDSEEMIKRAAFRFIDERSFMQALVRSVEGSIRSFVATHRQNEILTLRSEIVDAVNDHIELELNDWGYHLLNLQINDISFDEAIMRSMAQVVATNNMKIAAENEAQAQFISKTRVAEAEAQARRTVAAADRDVEALRGQGNAQMREAIAQGLSQAGEVMQRGGVDPAFMLYTMWLDAMKFVASHGQGNLMSFDGSMDGFEKVQKQMGLLARKADAPANHH